MFRDPNEIPGTEYFAKVHGQHISENESVQQKTKFAKKYLVWQAIAEDGDVSEPFITTGTINQHIYLEECLRKRFLPFLESKRDKGKILFWPDLASAHYAHSVTTFMKEQNINFVPKKINSPNVPQIRPIEKYWALCKVDYKRRKVTAKKNSWFQDDLDQYLQKSGNSVRKKSFSKVFLLRPYSFKL